VPSALVFIRYSPARVAEAWITLFFPFTPRFKHRPRAAASIDVWSDVGFACSISSSSGSGFLSQSDGARARVRVDARSANCVD